jgi:hypothetical protein
MCAPWVTAHINTICKFLPHTRVNMGASVFFTVLLYILLQWSMPLGQRGHVILSVGRSFAYFVWNSRHTVTTDLLVWYSSTQNDLSPGAAIFSLHTLASPSGRNVNYDEKQLTGKQIFELFYLYRFHKYMSYGFPIIHFCNPGVHYEMPSIYVYREDSISFIKQRVFIFADSSCYVCCFLVTRLIWNNFLHIWFCRMSFSAIAHWGRRIECDILPSNNSSVQNNSLFRKLKCVRLRTYTLNIKI